MKKEKLKYPFVFFIILIFLLIVLSRAPDQSMTGYATYNPVVASDCSNESIEAVWNSIFEEPSWGEVEVPAGACRDSGDCEPTGFNICQDNLCRTTFCYDGGYMNPPFTNCPTGQTCRNYPAYQGICVQTCTSDSNCPTNQICRDGICKGELIPGNATKITIKKGEATSNGCDMFVAYYESSDTLWFLKALNDESFEPSYQINAFISGSGAPGESYFVNIIEDDLGNIIDNYDFGYDNYSTFKKSSPRTPIISGITNAYYNFNNLYKISTSLGDWESDEVCLATWRISLGVWKCQVPIGGPFWNDEDMEDFSYFTDDGTSAGSELKGKVSSTKDFSLFTYEEDSCTNHWGSALYKPCVNDLKTKYYESSVDCGHAIGLPADNGTIIYEDCDTNGIIGIPDYIQIKNTNNLSIDIDDDDFEDFEGSTDEEKVEIFEGSTKIIEFTWDFADVLDLSKLYIEKQKSSSNFGYLIVNGIDEEKTVWVNGPGSSTTICIKDKEINDIDEISDDCDESNEYLLTCPGSVNDFSCTISGNKFVVEGLDHSAVKQTTISGTSCTDTCFSKGYDCGTHTICGTSVNCGNCSTGYTCSQGDCIFIDPTCTPDWNCDPWSECINGEKTRTCIDDNCGQPSKTEDKNCSEALEEFNWTYGIIILIIVIIIGVILGLLIHFIRKKKDSLVPNSTIKPKPKTPPHPPRRPPIQPQAQRFQQRRPY